MYVNVSENQVDTLKDAIRLKKGATHCFPKGGIRGDHVLLLTPAQINRLDKALVKGRRAKLHMIPRTSSEEYKLHWRFSRYVGITRCSYPTYNLDMTYNWTAFWWY